MVLKIGIDPGHGGTDPGAVANGYTEKVLNLSVAHFLNAELLRCGYETFMTRTEDVFVEVAVRGELAKKNNCNCLLSCHFNNMGDGSGTGCETIYSIGDQSAQWTASCIADQVCSTFGLYRRGVWTRESSQKNRNWYGVLRSFEPCPAVILEPLFLDNLKDIQHLKEAGFLKLLAVSYAKGLGVAYGIKYVPESNPNDANWLHEHGYTEGVHKLAEQMTFGDFENIMKRKAI